MGRLSKREQRERPQAPREREQSVVRPAEPEVRGQAEDGGQQAAVDSDAVARRAYDRYQSRGGEHGRDQEDWLEAEREVRNKQDE